MNEIVNAIAPKALWHLGNNIVITQTVLWTWIVMAFIILVAIYVRIRLKLVPENIVQNIVEMVLYLLKSLAEGIMGKKDAAKYFKLVATIGIFVVISDIIPVVPGVKSPTADLNTTVAFAFVVFMVAQTSGLIVKGPVEYAKGFLEPIFLWLPLNIIGEIAKMISHSFRLFGNIVGGTVIVLIMSMLFGKYLVPGILNAWFGIIVGIIQAFVFFILAAAYIMVAMK